MELQVIDLEKRMASLGKTLKFSSEAKKLILGSVDTLNFGARPLRRKIETLVENQIASILISSEGSAHSSIKVDVGKGEIVVSSSN